MLVKRCDNCKSIYQQDKKFFTIGEPKDTDTTTGNSEQYAIIINKAYRYPWPGRVYTSLEKADLCKNCIQKLVAQNVDGHIDPDWKDNIKEVKHE